MRQNSNAIFKLPMLQLCYEATFSQKKNSQIFGKPGYFD